MKSPFILILLISMLAESCITNQKVCVKSSIDGQEMLRGPVVIPYIVSWVRRPKLNANFNQTGNGQEIRAMHFHSQMIDTNSVSWSRRWHQFSMPFEVDLPYKGKYSLNPQVPIYIDVRNDKEYLFYYTDGEIVKICPNLFVSYVDDSIMSRCHRVKDYYVCDVLSELEYIDTYDSDTAFYGLGSEGDRFITDEEVREHVAPGIECDMDIAQNVHKIPISKEEYRIKHGRKTFYFIKDETSVLLYNIKPENFLYYYNLIKRSLNIISIDSTLFYRPIEPVICNWREQPVDSMPSKTP